LRFSALCRYTCERPQQHVGAIQTESRKTVPK
jgi:hypothetical protein